MAPIAASAPAAALSPALKNDALHQGGGCAIAVQSAELAALPGSAQPLDQLDGGIGVRRKPELHLGGLDAGARGGAELAVDLAHLIAAPRQELLQLLDLLERQLRDRLAAAVHG